MNKSQRNRDLANLGAVVLVYGLADLLLPRHYPIGVFVAGVTQGGLEALVALGLVLVARSTGVINFSQVAVGSVGASTAIALHADHVSFWLALPMGLLVSILLGFVVVRVVVARFATAPPLVLTVATVGVLLALGSLNIALPKMFGVTDRAAATARFRVPWSLHIGLTPYHFGWDAVLVMTCVPIVLLILWWFLLRTDRGVALRAAADNPERALLLGIPIRAAGTATWMMAAGMAGMGATLSAALQAASTTTSHPLQSISMASFGSLPGADLLMIPVAAVILAGMESLPLTVVWAMGLGVLQQGAQWTYPGAPITQILILWLILGGLVFYRRRQEVERLSLFGRFVAFREVPPIPAPLARLREVKMARLGGLSGLAVIGLVLPLVISSGSLAKPIQFEAFALVAMSLVVLTGWAGQISLGQFGLAGIGSAVTGALIFHFQMNLVTALIGSTVIGGVVAVIVGIPALRIPGLYLAVATLALAVPVQDYLLNGRYLPWLDPSHISPPKFLVWSTGSTTVIYEASFVALVGSLIIGHHIRRSRAGRVIVASRENETAAAAYGISPLRVKLMAFAFAGGLAALAGGLMTVSGGGVVAGSFTPTMSFVIFAAAVIGGLGSITGALLGAAFVTIALSLPQGIGYLLIGAGLVVVLIELPDGLAGLLTGIRDRVLEQWAVPILLRPRPAAGANTGPASAPGTLLTRMGRGRRIADHRLPIGRARPSGRRLKNDKILEAAGRLEELELLEMAGEGTAAGQISPALPADGQEPIISLFSVVSGYRRTQVLSDLSLGVAQGEVVALLGTNGAGKTTTLRTIAGLIPPRAGRITFVGNDITDWTPVERVRAGLVTVLEGQSIFPTLSVRENLRMGAWMAQRRVLDDEFAKAATERVLGLFPVLGERLDVSAGLLSGGEQHMLTLAQALMCRPKLLLIDELSMGLAPKVVSDLLEVIRSLAVSGVTVVVVEQSINVATAISSRAVFLERGRARFSGPTPDLADQPVLLRGVFTQAANRVVARRKEAIGALNPGPSHGNGAPEPVAVVEPVAVDGAVPGDGGGAGGSGPDVELLVNGAGVVDSDSVDRVPGGDFQSSPGATGEPHCDLAPPAAHESAGAVRSAAPSDTPAAPPPVPALAVLSVAKAFGGVDALEDVTLHVMPGEILGVIGSNGAGKTTLFDICSGFTIPDRGRVAWFGADVGGRSPAQRSRLGLGRVFQQARLWPAMTVSEAIMTALEERLPFSASVSGALGFESRTVAGRARHGRLNDLLVLFGLTRWRDRFLGEVSTGIRRLTELACVTAKDPTVLLLDEPTAGIARQESTALADVILGMRQLTGAAFVIIEHDIPLVASVADRLACMHLGRLIAEGDPVNVLREDLVVDAYLSIDDALSRSAVGKRESASARVGW